MARLLYRRAYADAVIVLAKAEQIHRLDRHTVSVQPPEI
jgi:hypothetical protein